MTSVSLPWLVTGTWWIPEQYRREVGLLVKAGEVVLEFHDDGWVTVIRDNPAMRPDVPHGDAAALSQHL